jgi:hypothetical protein
MRAAFAMLVSKAGRLPLLVALVAPGESWVTARSFSSTPQALAVPGASGIA